MQGLTQNHGEKWFRFKFLNATEKYWHAKSGSAPAQCAKGCQLRKRWNYHEGSFCGKANSCNWTFGIEEMFSMINNWESWKKTGPEHLNV